MKVKNNYLLILIILQFAVNYLSKGILKTEQLTNNQIEEILNLKQKWEWLEYAVLPSVIFT